MHDGTFSGGKVLQADAQNYGVGLPEENPGLREDVQKTISLLYQQIQNREIQVTA